MHCVNSNILAVTSLDGEGLPAEPGDVVVVLGLDPALATPGGGGATSTSREAEPNADEHDQPGTPPLPGCELPLSRVGVLSLQVGQLPLATEVSGQTPITSRRQPKPHER